MKTKDLFIISRISGVGKITLKAFVDYIRQQNIRLDLRFTQVKEIFEQLREKNKKIRIPSLEEFNLACRTGFNIVEQSELNEVQMMSILDDDFPMLLRDIPNSPVILHYKGDKNAYHNKCLAIIGTREPTRHGEIMGERLSEFYTDAGFTIVSGLAIGCDTIAHSAAVKKRNPSIAILAGGLNSIYPKQNRVLAEEILSYNGLLISEYEYGMPSNKNFFVERDRLQSGISEGIVVIETAIKGGTRHTVAAAYAQKRLIGCLFTHIGEKINLGNEDKFQGNVDIVNNQGGIKLDSKDSLMAFKEMLEGRFFNRVRLGNSLITKEQNSENEDVNSIVLSEVSEANQTNDNRFAVSISATEKKSISTWRIDPTGWNIKKAETGSYRVGSLNKKDVKGRTNNNQLNIFNDDNI